MSNLLPEDNFLTMYRELESKQVVTVLLNCKGRDQNLGERRRLKYTV